MKSDITAERTEEREGRFTQFWAQWNNKLKGFTYMQPCTDNADTLEEKFT